MNYCTLSIAFQGFISTVVGQMSDAGHSHVTHTKKAGGYSNEVWSRSLKPRLSYGQLCCFTVKMDI